MKFSGCLIEALKYKIKNKKKVNVYLYVSEVKITNIPHFIFSMEGKLYHFHAPRNKNITWYNCLLFKGCLSEFPTNKCIPYYGKLKFII